MKTENKTQTLDKSDVENGELRIELVILYESEIEKRLSLLKRQPHFLLAQLFPIPIFVDLGDGVIGC